MLNFLRITPKKNLSLPVELNETLNRLLQQASREEIAQVPIRCGRNEIRFDDVFHLEELPETSNQFRTVTWEGNFSLVHGIGKGWANGDLTVIGNAGDCLGQQMSGGIITVSGNTGDFVGSSLSGGVIRVSGTVGNYVGAPAPGEYRGMTGGEILIKGSAGDYVGKRMRRGTIVVEKSAGDFVAEEMFAGSIILCESPQGRIGLGMKRGSIILLNREEETKPAIPTGPYFDYAVTYSPVFLKVLLNHLNQKHGFDFDHSFFEANYERYSGDMTEMEKGEILVRSCSL